MPAPRIVKINAKKMRASSIKKAVAVLKKGGVIAMPTETVYGLAALASNKKAVGKIYRLKKRAKKKKLPWQVASIEEIKKLGGEITDEAGKVLKRLTPGPLTIILKKRGGSRGFRIPEHAVARRILEMSGGPVAVTSANITGRKEAASAREVARIFGDKLDLIVDGGQAPLHKPSTVVDFTGNKWKIVRPGKITAKKIRDAIGKR